MTVTIATFEEGGEQLDEVCGMFGRRWCPRFAEQRAYTLPIGWLMASRQAALSNDLGPPCRFRCSCRSTCSSEQPWDVPGADHGAEPSTESTTRGSELGASLTGQLARRVRSLRVERYLGARYGLSSDGADVIQD